MVDEDVKSIGISNRDIRLLDTCMGMLEKDRDSEKALRILKRYTNQQFDAVAEWRKWLNEYPNQLFFSELNGYKYIGDGSRGTKTMANPEDVERPVVIRTERSGSGEDQEIRILMNIRKGYHIYASGGKDCPFILTRISLTYPQGVEPLGEMQLPVSEQYAGDDGVRVYEGNVVFVQKIKIGNLSAAGGEIKCEVVYQCCNLEICLPPEKETYRIKL